MYLILGVKLEKADIFVYWHILVADRTMIGCRRLPQMATCVLQNSSYQLARTERVAYVLGNRMGAAGEGPEAESTLVGCRYRGRVVSRILIGKSPEPLFGGGRKTSILAK